MYTVNCTNCDSPTLDHIVSERRAHKIGAWHCEARGCPTDAIEVEVAGDA